MTTSVDRNGEAKINMLESTNLHSTEGNKSTHYDDHSTFGTTGTKFVLEMITKLIVYLIK